MTDLEKVKEILASHDIRMNFESCGCCEGPVLTFEYKGKIIVEGAELANIVMIEGKEEWVTRNKEENNEL